jgi:hypothetical protein
MLNFYKTLSVIQCTVCDRIFEALVNPHFQCIFFHSRTACDGMTYATFRINQNLFIMKKIETKTHGYLDYIVGVLLMASPWIFDFYRGGAETWVPVILGAGAIIYSLLTDYELGAFPMISMRTHLMLDVASGIILAISPWLFGFAEYIWGPHLILGLLEIGAAMMTRRVPSVERRTHHHQQHRTAV